MFGLRGINDAVYRREDRATSLVEILDNPNTPEIGLHPKRTNPPDAFPSPPARVTPAPTGARAPGTRSNPGPYGGSTPGRDGEPGAAMSE